MLNAVIACHLHPATSVCNNLMSSLFVNYDLCRKQQHEDDG
jgi:hypothetical protein